MEQVQISLTLNKKTKIVTGNVVGNRIFVPGIEMTTTSGNKTHLGYIRFNLGKTEYTIEDANDIGYSGMRGNGYGKKSNFRHIGFKNDEPEQIMKKQRNNEQGYEI
jgi:hypothetical protein